MQGDAAEMLAELQDGEKQMVRQIRHGGAEALVKVIGGGSNHMLPGAGSTVAKIIDKESAMKWQIDEGHEKFEQVVERMSK